MELQQIGSVPAEEKIESKPFKKLLHDFMGYTTVHGVGRLAEAKNTFWKIFWSLVCLGTFGMFIYQAIGLLQQYNSNPVSTLVSITSEKRLPFPAVTICNLNMLRKNFIPPIVRTELKMKMNYFWGTTNGSESRNSPGSPTTDMPSTDYYPDSSSSSSSGDDIYNGDEYSEYHDDVNEYNSGHYEEDEFEDFPDESALTVEERKRLEIGRVIGNMHEEDLYNSGHQLDNLVRSCSWKGIDCKLGNLNKFWTRQLNYKYGNCFTFNGGKDQAGHDMRVLTATKPGPSHGLLLELDTEEDYYIGPLAIEVGIRVLLHGQGFMTFPYEEGFSVSPRMLTSVGIKKTQIVRLDRFNNKSCFSANELPLTNIYRRYKNITTYSQQACLNSCLGLSQRIRCGCCEKSFPSEEDPCDALDSEKNRCLRVVQYLFNNDKLSCLDECRQPCKEEIIQKTISSSQWPSKAYKDYRSADGGKLAVIRDYRIAREMYFKEYSDKLLQLNVFFNEMNYEKIQEHFSYGTINLLADIGGQLGFWIGLSVITVCELLELIVMLFTVCYKMMNNAVDKV